MITFICAVYNEEKEIIDLLKHVTPYVDAIRVVDDGSTDRTPEILKSFQDRKPYCFQYKVIQHTGLPETVKNEALQMVPDKSWVLMLDADERFITPLANITEWVKGKDSEKTDFVTFEQFEILDGNVVRVFQKVKLFRKGAITFPLNNIHADDIFRGEGADFGWQVAHRKGSYKQIQRELEYLKTYDKLLEEGHIDEGRRNWLRGLHHYVKEPHG